MSERWRWSLNVVMMVSAIVPVPTPAPSPEPTDLKEIARIKSSPVCRTVDALVLPVTVVAERNERDFVALEAPIAKFRSGKGSQADGLAIHNALTQGSIGLQSIVMSDGGAAADRDPLSTSEDDENTYTPERTMAASNIERIVGDIQHNLVAADKAMTESWKANPGTSNAAVSALRQRMQNIIDLQRALAFRFDDVAGTYFSNRGGSQLTPKSQRAAYETLLDQMIDAQLAQDEVAAKSLSLAVPSAPAGDVGSLKRGSAGEIAVALRGQEMALASEGAVALRSCNETLKPNPAPSR